jgi:CHAT domain
LMQMPFDLLCTELPKGKANYKKLPYLFLKQRVSYQYSVASWFDASSESISPASYYIMAMSPSSDSLRNLQADYLLKRFSATTYKGVAAKKSAFLEQAPRYGFIHLGYNANKMGLLFGENENLSDAEREGLKLDAALVLLPHLSVPNVFNVELEFLHAGAGSLLSSFWDVEDETASVELFNYFYEYLQKGLSKDEALRRARLEYLEKMPDDKLAPLYWGQFRQVGDFRNVAVSEPISYIWWYLLPILGMLAVGWWAMRGLRQRR